jgi:hypothetical protein
MPRVIIRLGSGTYLPAKETNKWLAESSLGFPSSTKVIDSNVQFVPNQKLTPNRLQECQYCSERGMLEHLLVFSWNCINVIFLIKKLHLCHPKWHRCNFLITSMSFHENTRRCSNISRSEKTKGNCILSVHIYIYIYIYNKSPLCSGIFCEI